MSNGDFQVEGAGVVFDQELYQALLDAGVTDNRAGRIARIPNVRTLSPEAIRTLSSAYVTDGKVTIWSSLAGSTELDMSYEDFVQSLFTGAGQEFSEAVMEAFDTSRQYAETRGEAGLYVLGQRHEQFQKEVAEQEAKKWDASKWTTEDWERAYAQRGFGAGREQSREPTYEGYRAAIPRNIANPNLQRFIEQEYENIAAEYRESGLAEQPYSGGYGQAVETIGPTAAQIGELSETGVPLGGVTQPRTRTTIQKPQGKSFEDYIGGIDFQKRFGRLSPRERGEWQPAFVPRTRWL